MTTVNSTETKIEYKEDAGDTLTRLTAQLRAMLTAIYGSGFAEFDMLDDKVKQNYLWACSDKAAEIDDLVLKIAFKEV